MILQKHLSLFLIICWIQFDVSAQHTTAGSSMPEVTNEGWFSLGGRSTVNLFGQDGTGIGTGGQFRIQVGNRLNTDWFADYIIVNSANNIRSEYYHIGWSVLYYPFEKLQYPQHTLQPYILAGHCFDYNKKTVMADKSITKDRWGSAVQAGLGTHFNLSPRFDISLTSQYMIHLTKELHVESSGNTYTFTEHKHSTLQGHVLTTISINYKIFKLWGK